MTPSFMSYDVRQRRQTAEERELLLALFVLKVAAVAVIAGKLLEWAVINPVFGL